MHPDQADDQPASHERDLDALIARRDAAHAELDASIVIMSAEQTVMLSPINALAADTNHARHRLAVAHDNLTTAYHQANPDVIAVARREVNSRRDELDRIALSNINEMTVLIGGGLTNLDVAMTNKRTADGAHEPVVDATESDTA